MCLRVGMKPELVDASLRKKSLKKKTENYGKPVLIDNLEPLGNMGVVSSVLQVIQWIVKQETKMVIGYPP
jgi:hypothetical protein